MRGFSDFILFLGFLFAYIPYRSIFFHIYSIKHVSSPTVICHKESESSFHPLSHPNLGACGEYSSLLEAGSVHVKELFQRIRSSKRKMSLACMEHYHSLSEFFLASHFSTWLHPLGDSWQ